MTAWRGLGRHRRALDGLDDQIREHLEREIQVNLNRGMTYESARREAYRKFGNVGLVKEDARAVWIPRWIDQASQDIRYGLRNLRRNPTFTLIAVLTLALGIGANTAIFSVGDAILLQALPYPDAERLVALRSTH